MKAVKNLVDWIDDELKGAQEYAEKYVEEKSENNGEWANIFRGMAEDELNHATKVHEYAVLKIKKLNQVYVPTQDMLDKWDAAHKVFVDKTAWIKQMLAM